MKISSLELENLINLFSFRNLYIYIIKNVILNKIK